MHQMTMNLLLMDKWDYLEGLTEEVRQDLRRIELGLGVVTLVEHKEGLMGWQEEQDEVILTEPILAKRDCKVEITAVEATEWTVKETSKGGAPGHEGEKYPAAKMTLLITDEEIQTEHEGSRPRLTLEHQFNLQRYPYLDKKSGTVKWLGRANLYELEEAFGFDPIFTNGEGQSVEPYITRAGRKVAPKGEGIKRQLNPAFLQAYFTSEGAPNLEWAGRTVYADIGIERDEQYGDKNRIQRFKRTPISV